MMVPTARTLLFSALMCAGAPLTGCILQSDAAGRAAGTDAGSGAAATSAKLCTFDTMPFTGSGSVAVNPSGTVLYVSAKEGVFRYKIGAGCALSLDTAFPNGLNVKRGNLIATDEALFTGTPLKQWWPAGSIHCPGWSPTAISDDASVAYYPNGPSGTMTVQTVKLDASCAVEDSGTKLTPTFSYTAAGMGPNGTVLFSTPRTTFDADDVKIDVYDPMTKSLLRTFPSKTGGYLKELRHCGADICDFDVNMRAFSRYGVDGKHKATLSLIDALPSVSWSANIGNGTLANGGVGYVSYEDNGRLGVAQAVIP